MRRLFYLLMAALGSFTLAHVASAVAAADFPNRPIYIVVPTTSGGAADIMTRLIAQKLSMSMHVSVIVENKPGAGNIIGSEFVAKAPADGYTLLMTYTDHVFNQFLHRSMPYDTVKAFAPITEIGSVPMMLVVNSKVQAKSVADLIALAKAAPGTVNYASAGNGTSLHLAAVLFASMAHIDVMHIPYKGTTPGLQDLLGGRVQFMFPTVVSVAPQLKGGKVRALGVTSASRVPGLPDVPAIAETPGMAGYESAIWYGVLAPAHTPPDVIAKLNAEFRKALADPDTSARLAAQGVVIKTGTPAQFGDKINAELARWGKVIRQNGIQLD